MSAPAILGAPVAPIVTSAPAPNMPQAPSMEGSSLADAMADIQTEALDKIEGLSFLDDEPAGGTKPDPKPTEPEPKKDELGDIDDLEFLGGTGGKKKKADAKPAEVKPVNPDEIPDAPPGQSTEKAKIGWGELRTELKTKTAELETLKTTYETQIAELKEKLTNLPEIEEKAKYVEEAEKELAIHKVEASREYKKLIDEPIAKISDRAVAIAKKYDLEATEVFAALEERDPDKREELLDVVMTGMGEASKMALLTMANDTQAILDHKDKLHAKALEAKGQLDAKTKAQEAAEKTKHQEAYKANVTKRTKDFAAKIPFVALKDGETAEQVFKAIAENANATVFDATDPDVQAYSVAAGITLPRVVAQLRLVLKEKAALETRLKDFSSSTPSTRPGSPTSLAAAETPANWHPGM